MVNRQLGPSAESGRSVRLQQGSARAGFSLELQELQSEVTAMAGWVERALSQAADVILSGDLQLANEVIEADDQVDSTYVAVTEHCYDLLVRQSPVASDLRLVVSALRIAADLERTGDLCLRIVKLAPDHHLLQADPETFGILRQMAEAAVELFRAATSSWATRDLRLAHSLEKRDDLMDDYNAYLMEGILKMQGPFAVPQAVKTILAGRALERIADHSVLIGERLRYMLTGDSESLTNEVGP